MASPEKQKALYYKRKELGICTRCGKENAATGKINCITCAEKISISRKENRQYFLKRGLCTICGKREAEPNKKICYECLGQEQDKYYEKRVDGTYNKQKADTERKRKLAEERRNNGLCYRCGKYKADGLCAFCKAKAKRYRDKKRQDIDRSEWVSYGLCYCCGKNKLYKDYKVCESCYNVRLSTVPKMLAGMNKETNCFARLNNLHFAKK